MPNLDEERFEKYLEQFRPLTPDELPLEIRTAPRRNLPVAVWAMGALAIVAFVVTGLWILNYRVPDQPNHFVATKLPAPTPPFTIRHANNLLATAPSYKAVMNELAFPVKGSNISKGKQSALAVLGKEKIKL